MAFALHPLLSTYPGASFVPNGNLTGPHLALASGGDSAGYWGHVPLLPPPLPQPLYPQHQPEPLYSQHQPQPLHSQHQAQPLYPPHQAQPLYLENQAQTLHLHPAILGLQSPWSWNLPPAVVAAHEGRGTGVYGLLPEQLERGAKGAAFNYGWPRYGPMPLKPELGGFVGKINPYGRSFPHGYYKTTY